MSTSREGYREGARLCQFAERDLDHPWPDGGLTPCPSPERPAISRRSLRNPARTTSANIDRHRIPCQHWRTNDKIPVPPVAIIISGPPCGLDGGRDTATPNGLAKTIQNQLYQSVVLAVGRHAPLRRTIRRMARMFDRPPGAGSNRDARCHTLACSGRAF